MLERLPIKVGPYRRVRHPMYTVLFLIPVVYFLISANWFMGVIWVSWVVGTVATGVTDEESAMIDKFGDEYRTCMRHTGRFLPHLG